MKHKLFFMGRLAIAAVICLAPCLLLAQESQVLKPLPEFISPTMHKEIAGTIPENFQLVEENRPLIVGPTWRRTNGDQPWQKDFGFNAVAGPVLQSNDKQCELLINSVLYFMPTEELPGMYYPFYPWRLHHRNIFMYDFMSIYDGRTDYSVEDFVTKFGGKQARERFNADSVFTYNLPIQPLRQDDDEYKYCTLMFIWKEGKSMVSLAWFFTDGGKKEEQFYIDHLSKHIWYVEEK